MAKKKINATTEAMNSLSVYEKNFEYIQTGILYPTLTKNKRRELVRIHNDIFSEKLPESRINCLTCMRDLVKKLADTYNELIRTPSGGEEEN